MVYGFLTSMKMDTVYFALQWSIKITINIMGKYNILHS
jgi:hypothetical protein